jgi:hypothetical protein
VGSVKPPWLAPTVVPLSAKGRVVIAGGATHVSPPLAHDSGAVNPTTNSPSVHSVDETRILIPLSSPPAAVRTALAFSK